MSDKPQLLIVGGPNGSGKTTVATQYSADQSVSYIGADAIAASLVPADPTSARIAAGREFSRRVGECLANGTSVVVESTLSGRSLRRRLIEARQRGFEITIVFVFVESEDVCVARVAARVRKGGHDVPEIDIRRRFARSITNFWNIYRELADNWVVLYNGGSRIQDISAGSRSQVTIRDSTLHSHFLTSVESHDD